MGKVALTSVSADAFPLVVVSMSSTVRSLKYLRTAVLLALAGGVHALAFAPDPLPSWSLAIVQVLALAVLVRAVDDAAYSWQAFLCGWWFGLVNFGVGLYWLFISMSHYGGLSALLSVAGVFTLSAFLALFTAIACGLFAWLRPMSIRGAPLTQGLAWAGAWVSMEWSRGVLFSGFPWLNIGYAHVDGPLAGWAPLLGVHGMALFAAFAAAIVAALRLPFLASTRSTVPALVMAFVLFATGGLLSRIEWSTADGKALNVRLVQGNIEQSQKFDPTLLEHGINSHLRLAAQPHGPNESPPDLIVLPETALPVFQDQLDSDVWEAWRGVAQSQDSSIVIGLPLRTMGLDGRWHLTNSAISFDADTPVQQLTAGTMPHRYDKRHLVPWGEYVPPGFEWFVQMLDMPLGEFDRGPVRQTPFEVGGQHLALNICYENVFGSELLPALLRGAGGDPAGSVLVNLSNLGWFGDTWALRQHLQISRLRSIETARPMVTSTNTGITASIDSHGRVMAELAPHQAGALQVAVQGMAGLTPYTRFGDASVLLLAGAFLVIAAWCRCRRGYPSGTVVQQLKA